MFNNRANKQSERTLGLIWLATHDQSKPLRSYWSDEMTTIRMHHPSEVRNAAVMEKCETSVIRTPKGKQTQSLTMCGT